MAPPAEPGRLIAVVGPSGAGKDTLIDAACATRPDLMRARRVITRPRSAGDEPHESVSEAEFLRRHAAGAFLFSWQAHGLHYGIPQSVADRARAGQTILINGSRSALPVMLAQAPALHVILVTADADTLARRLHQRGREGLEDIRRRIARGTSDLPPQVQATPVDNSGPLSEGLARFLAAIDVSTAAPLSSSRDIQALAQDPAARTAR